MPLSSRDYRLSMRTSPRPQGREDEGLRSLLTHRLRDAAKAVVRLPLKSNIATAALKKYSVYCEPCRDWLRLPQWGEEINCPKCGRLYVLELAVFSAVPDTTD
jgi:hypothetical protein